MKKWRGRLNLKKVDTVVLLRAIVIFSPIIAGFIIASISGTSICNLDAWNTTWNDEIGYYRTVEIGRAHV